MKKPNECLKFKEMIMEKADGQASVAVLEAVSAHIKAFFGTSA